jgi:hypothetical protein
MGTILEFKTKGPSKTQTWLFDISIFECETGTMGRIIDANLDLEGMDEGERWEMLADHLDALSFMMHQEAKAAGAEKGSVIATCQLFEDGTSRVRVDDSVTTDAQVEWVIKGLASAQVPPIVRAQGE